MFFLFVVLLSLSTNACETDSSRDGDRQFIEFESEGDEELVFTDPMPVDVSNIQVVKIDQHPMLVDHGKELRIVDGEGRIIDHHVLYGDPGVGCNSYLFDTGDTFTLIECNSRWLTIDKSSGQIEVLPWEEDAELPADYIGTFRRQRGERLYERVEDENPTTDEVYQFKDPAFWQGWDE